MGNPVEDQPLMKLKLRRTILQSKSDSKVNKLHAPPRKAVLALSTA